MGKRAGGKGARLHNGAAATRPMLSLLFMTFLARAAATVVDGNCPSRNIFDSIVNAATTGLNYADANAENKVFVTIVFSVVIALGLFLLLTGKKFVRGCVVVVVGATSFVVSLYLFDWCLTSTASLGDSFFVTCWLPFVLAVLSSILFTFLVLCCIGEIEWLAVFVLGAGSGAFGMLVLRNFVTASDPSLANDPSFFWYWMGMGVVAIVCGVLAVCWRKLVFFVASITIGSYLVASAVMGLIQAYVDGGASGWIFYGIFGGMCTVGALVQIYVFGALLSKEGKEKQKKRREAHLKKEEVGPDVEKAEQKEDANLDQKMDAGKGSLPPSKHRAMNSKKMAAVRERAAGRPPASPPIESSPLEFLTVLNPLTWFGGGKQ